MLLSDWARCELWHRERLPCPWRRRNLEDDREREQVPTPPNVRPERSSEAAAEEGARRGIRRPLPRELYQRAARDLGIDEKLADAAMHDRRIPVRLPRWLVRSLPIVAAMLVGSALLIERGFALNAVAARALEARVARGARFTRSARPGGRAGYIVNWSDVFKVGQAPERKVSVRQRFIQQQRHVHTYYEHGPGGPSW